MQAGQILFTFWMLMQLLPSSATKAKQQILWTHGDFFYSLLIRQKFPNQRWLLPNTIIPVVINIKPTVRNGNTACFKIGSINFGRNAIKNKATFGFKTL